jgi:hypothetical protein
MQREAQMAKYIEPRELKEIGFLQEANRQFFHPHGLALKMTTFTDHDEYEFPYAWIGIPASGVAALRALLAGEPVERDLREKILNALDGAREYNPGDCFISGVRDCRDDPEGVIYGEWDDDSRAKAKRVAAERRRHRTARELLFGVNDRTEDIDDVEPVGWTAAAGAPLP